MIERLRIFSKIQNEGLIRDFSKAHTPDCWQVSKMLLDSDDCSRKDDNVMMIVI